MRAWEKARERCVCLWYVLSYSVLGESFCFCFCFCFSCSPWSFSLSLTPRSKSSLSSPRDGDNRLARRLWIGLRIGVTASDRGTSIERRIVCIDGISASSSVLARRSVLVKMTSVSDRWTRCRRDPGSVIGAAGSIGFRVVIAAGWTARVRRGPPFWFKHRACMHYPQKADVNMRPEPGTIRWGQGQARE